MRRSGVVAPAEGVAAGRGEGCPWSYCREDAEPSSVSDGRDGYERRRASAQLHRGRQESHPSRLRARPTPTVSPSRSVALGEPQPLGLAPGARDALLYVPPGLGQDTPEWFVLCLHGAGGNATRGLRLLLPFADAAGLVLLAPSSKDATWDAIRDGYGADVAAIDRAMNMAFGRVRVAPRRLAVAGFSDGASYALGLGLANGNLFSRVIAFSPGFIPQAPRLGRPAVFVSHGTRDSVLPIDRTSRRIVPALREDGYSVTYREFDGGHTVPPAAVKEATSMLAPDARQG